MLPLANWLALSELQRAIENALGHLLLTIDNAALILSVADRLGGGGGHSSAGSRLRSRCLAFVCAEENFSYVCRTPGFARLLPKELILELLSRHQGGI